MKPFRFVIIIVVAVLLGVIAFRETPSVRARGIAAPNASVPQVNPNMNAKYVGGIQASKLPAANKLLPLGANNKFPLAVIPQGSGSGLDADKVDGLDATVLQKRVTGTCAAGNAVNSIGANGTVGCQATGGLTLPFSGSGTNSSPLWQITNSNGSAIQGQSPELFGVSGYTTVGTGVYGDNGNSNSNGHAGYFNGRVHVTKGLVVEGNLSAPNLPGVAFTQGGDNVDSIQNTTKDLDSITIAVPASGYLMLTSSVEVAGFYGEFNLNFSLLDVTNGNTQLTSVPNFEPASNPLFYLRRTMDLSWVVPVNAGSHTYKTQLQETGNWAGQLIYRHHIIAMYFPVQY